MKNSKSLIFYLEVVVVATSLPSDKSIEPVELGGPDRSNATEGYREVAIIVVIILLIIRRIAISFILDSSSDSISLS